MHERQPDVATTHATSTGHIGAAGVYLDAHFEACRPEYEAMLRSVGIQPGWRVLDAGCGRGNYVPLIAEAVGPTGAIAALDLAPENVATVEQSVTTWPLPTPVTAHVGSLLALPFPDGHFDAVWCANALEYLPDADLPTALAECCRVVRPGGLVAIKDSAMAHWVFAPADPALCWRILAAWRLHSDPVHGQLRSPQTRQLLEAAGLEAVWQRTSLIEWWAPLRPVAREFIGAFVAIFAEHAPVLELSEEDQAFWQRHLDPWVPGHVADQPDFYWCEGHIVAVGAVPDSPAS